MFLFFNDKSCKLLFFLKFQCFESLYYFKPVVVFIDPTRIYVSGYGKRPYDAK